MIQISDTRASSVCFLYTRTRELGQCEVDYRLRMSTIEGIRELTTTETKKNSRSAIKNLITDRELLNSEFLSGCPLRHKVIQLLNLLYHRTQILCNSPGDIGAVHNLNLLLGDMFLVAGTGGAVVRGHAEI